MTVLCVDLHDLVRTTSQREEYDQWQVRSIIDVPDASGFIVVFEQEYE